MQNANPPRKFGIRMRWLVLTAIALLAPALFLLPRGGTQQRDPNRPVPDVVRMIGPVSQDRDLRDLPYIPPTPREEEEKRLSRHPPKESAEGRGVRGVRAAEREAEREMEREHELEAEREAGLVAQQKRKSPKAPNVLKSDTTARVVSPPPRVAPASPRPTTQQPSAPTPNIPSPANTFAGMTSQLACNGCLPPDTDGDVGPNHYVQAVNSSIRIHDKAGNVLAGPITFNSFFSAMGPSTPCGANANDGDPVVFYDHISDRWVITDFAFAAFPGTSFYQCIGVSKTSDPVTGGYWLYAVQVDPSNPNYLGDYPKFGLWPDAYYMSVNMFSNNTTFNGVRVYALDRNSMINGGPANTIAFSILPADLGDQYSLLPATFRTGDPPPAGQPEWFMNINSSATAGTVENQVFVRRFHADFVTPANSFFGVGATHTPDAVITVNGFVDAFNATSGTLIVPNGTANTTQYLDTLGDKLMYPLAYQNLNGVESIYSSHTVNNNQGGTGPTAIRWYQFNVTGNTVATTPVQQQSFNNGADGLWRAMPSINVDHDGNVAIGYTASSATVDPGIRYAGRLASDPPNTMAQGEAVMTPGTGHQTSTSGRWGDYSSMFVDPTDGCTFYHTNEYYSATSGAAWNTRVGAFKFPTCTADPIPTPTPTATPTPTPTPGTPPVSAGPVTITASAGTAGPTDYATLQAAFAAINAGTHQGAINVWILGNTTETASAVLNASGAGAAVYTSIVMVPSGTRTVSGNLAAPLIDLNGADVVTIDGLNAGGNSLTLSNTNTSTTAGTSTVRFINGAQNNTVTRCNIQGSSTVTVGTGAGGAVLFSTTTGVGNNGNTVSLNNVGPAGANLPVKAITAVGTTTNNNTINRDNVIDGNNVFDFFGTGAVSTTGIDIRTGNTNFTIQNNRIFQTATRTFTVTALRYTGITLVGTTGANGNAHTIRNNIIGFGAANGTGTTTITGTAGVGSSNEFRGLDLAAASSGTATSVQGNIISGINQTSSRNSTTAASSPFIGISLGTTSGVFDVGNLGGNQIGSLDGSSTIVINATSTTASNAPVIAIYDFSLSSGNVSNNNIGAITINSGGTGTTVGFRGILVNTSSAATETINNNTIGGPTAAGAITNNIVGSYVMYGIQTALPALSMTGNTVRNLVGNSTFPATVVGSGIVVNISAAVTNTSTISRNTVHSLSNSSGTAQTSIYAMDLTLPATTNVNTNVVERNLIHSIVNTSTDNTSQIWGIVQRGSGTAAQPVTASVRNNMIRLGLDAAGNSITSGPSIIGIRDIQGAVGGAGTTVVSYQFNSVYIGGTGVASASSTFAFNGSALVSTRSYVDNIFWNARSNASGAGKNYAIGLAGTAINPAGLTSNFNDLFASGTGGFVGLFNATDQTTLSNWQTATGQDANSVSVNPSFVNPNGSAATVDLHLQNGSPVLGLGTPVASITNDFDNDARDTVPDIGADEIAAAPLATVLGVAPATGTYGGTVNLSATLTASAVGVGGKSISFTLNGNPVGSATTDGSGVATLLNVSLVGINAGTYPTGVGASFAGDVSYNATSGTAVLTVNQATTTTALTSDINPSTIGQSVTFTATVTSAAGTPTGTVNFKEGVTTLGTDTLDGSGVATFSTSSLSAGSHNITAEYVGDTNFSGDTSDPLTQQVDAPAFSINNVSMAEGNAGTTTFTFTVARTGSLTLSSSVSYATADGTATLADNDYESASGVLNYGPGETAKQINVTVNGDTTPEVDETFTVVLSSPSSATISQDTGTGTISNDEESVTAGQLIISEFRLRGPGVSEPEASPSKPGRSAPCGSTNSNVAAGKRKAPRASVLKGAPLDPDTTPEANDEFIELYNATDSPLLVTTTDGSQGWAVAASDGVVRFIIPTGTVIPPRAHFLSPNLLGYSLGSVALGDFVIRGDNSTCFGYELDIPDNAGIALFRTSSVANFTTTSRLDAVGSTSEGNTLYREGAGYPALAAADTAQNLEHSFFRSLCSFVAAVGCTTPGVPKDSADNAADFLFVDTGATLTAAGRRLGAPGPESLTSPIRRDTSGVGAALLDNSAGSSAHPNRTRSFAPGSPSTSTFGTLTIRRRVVNNTGGNVTTLRFRIVELTTAPVLPGVADLRAITGIDEVTVGPVNDAATCTAAGFATTPCSINVQGTTLETASNQPNGGGINSTLSVTLSSPLANGASLPVNFLLGIQQTGTFRFLFIIEALP